MPEFRRQPSRFATRSYWLTRKRAAGFPGLSAADRNELSRLQRENKRVERDILSKAGAWFARECRPALPSNERELGAFPVAIMARVLNVTKGCRLRVAASSAVSACRC